ncbi:MAG: hypothetical protein K6G22_12730 [Lachnospiraceae bacterium]|nr:hypothetical protein [Lachnospiraceae bacterium]
MKEIIVRLQMRAVILKKAIAKAKKDTGPYPEGNLRISSNKKQVRYYHITRKGDTQGKYIEREHRDIAAALAQNEYNKQFLKKAEHELAMIERTISQFSRVNTDMIYENLSIHRRNLIRPYILTDELYAAEWQSRIIRENPYMPENRIYDTRKGERVRSKSEAILADMLYELGIPYHYEKPLKLINGKIRYPDFTMLKKRTREEIYLEHFGLMDNEEYLTGSLKKLDEYRNNGIYPGKNLMFTYETQDDPLDIKGIRTMLKEILLK